MNIRSGPVEFLAETSAPLRTIPNRAKEATRVVKRLQRIATQVEASVKINCALRLPDALSLIAALEAEADGLSPESHLSSAQYCASLLNGRPGLAGEIQQPLMNGSCDVFQRLHSVASR